MKPSRYPHALIGVPRALLQSDEWRSLPPVVKMVLITLLQYSSTETFKAVYPSRSTLAKAVGVSESTITQSVKKLEECQLIRSFEPCERRIGRDFRPKSKVYEFTLKRYINEDLAEKGVQVQSIFDYTRIESVLPKKIQDIITRLERTEERIEAVEKVLDAWSKRVKIVGTNGIGEVFADLHSKEADKETLEKALPPYLRLLPTENELIVNSRYTLAALTRDVQAAHEGALKAAKMQPLIDLLAEVG